MLSVFEKKFTSKRKSGTNNPLSHPTPPAVKYYSHVVKQVYGTM
jgi:hypothetical protein